MTAMHPLYSVAEIRAIEQAAQADFPPGTLMQRAGQAAAVAALALMSAPDSAGQPEARVLVLVGPGNNGGDALEVAFQLSQAGFEVLALMSDTAHRSADAQQALARAQSSAVQFVDPAFLPQIASTPWALVVDGLFGIGLQRPIGGALREVVDAVNRLRCPVLALDIPSGLDADSGNIVGAQDTAVRASHTITFIADKPGLHTCYGRDVAGVVQVSDLAIEDGYFNRTQTHLIEVASFSRSLRPRLHNSHKGSNGDVVIIGGAAGMAGAPMLSGRAAIQAGAGRVFAAFLDASPAYDAVQPELMCRHIRDCDLASAVLVIGPGLGTSAAAQDVLLQALQTTTPLVIDADALNLIAASASLQAVLAQRVSPTLMTPHPLEAARLLGIGSTDIQADRLQAARRLAQLFNAIIVLKGSGTVIADRRGNVALNPTGNPGLATAGTGDVLAGICGALLAQDWPVWEAALAAVWMHGKAADELLAQAVGPIGLTASELIPAVRRILNRLTAEQARR
jgi:hydroxyethylthiazole kinase-like uncharacterized protein yjeF